MKAIFTSIFLGITIGLIAWQSPQVAFLVFIFGLTVNLMIKEDV